MRTEAAPILVRGVYRRYSETPQSPNAVVTDAEREAITRHRNSQEYFNKVFLNPEEPRSLRFQEVEGGGAVHTLLQLQPWETGAAMATAATPDILEGNVQTDDKGRVPVQFIYDQRQGYHPNLQKAYHTELLRLMGAMKATPLPGETFSEDRPPVVAMENAVSTLGRGRTLSLQHGVVVKTGMPVDTETEPHFAYPLNLEQRLKLQYPDADDYVSGIAQSMTDELEPYGINLDFFLRKEQKPYGHTIVTPIYEDGNLETNGAMLAAIMHSHFEHAGEAQTKMQTNLGKAEERLREKGLIEPYAYRHYFYFRPDESGRSRLHITASLALLGGAAKEDAGGELDRSPDHDRQISLEQEIAYQKTLKDKLKQVA